MTQISNYIYCSDFLTSLDIKTKYLPNPYYDYPYLIIENFLSLQECKEINDSIKNEDFEIAQIKSDNTKSQTNEKIRKTNIFTLNDFHLKLYSDRFLEHKNQIESFFSLILTSSTKVQVLEYLKDSFYAMHSDDSNMLVKDEKIIGFNPVAKQRKISTVLFTTSYDDKTPSLDSFEGGELLFNFLFDENENPIKIKPKAGDMVVFLSNPFFTHEVLKVINGRRISLVQWHDAIIN